MNIILKDFLAQKPRDLITLKGTETVGDAIMKLEKSNITAAPVLEDDGSIVGFLDVLDLLAYLTKVCTKALSNTITGESRRIQEDDVRMMARRQKDFKIAAVKDIVDMSLRNPFTTISEDKTMKDALDSFTKGIHRVAVMSTDGKLTGIISQSDYLSFIEKDMDKYENLKSRKIKDCKNKNENLVGALPTVSTIDAFLTMHANKLSDLPLLDNMVLKGVITASDIKKAKLTENFDCLLKPAMEFMTDLRKQCDMPADYLVTCNDNSTMYEVIQKLCKEKVHRIFVVKENMDAVGVMSLTDILREMYMPMQTAM